MVTEHYDTIPDEKTIPSITVEDEEEEESDENEDEDDEEEEDVYSLEKGEDNDGYFYEGIDYGQNAFLIKEFETISITAYFRHYNILLKTRRKDFMIVQNYAHQIKKLPHAKSFHISW